MRGSLVKLDRRTVLRAGAAGMAAPFLMGRTTQAQEKTLYVNTWGGILTTS